MIFGWCSTTHLVEQYHHHRVLGLLGNAVGLRKHLLDALAGRLGRALVRKDLHGWKVAQKRIVRGLRMVRSAHACTVGGVVWCGVVWWCGGVVW